MRRPWALWLALTLALLAALAPGLSHGLARHHGAVGVQVEICSSAGVDGRRAPATGDPASDTLPGDVEHCPLCLLAQERLAAPPPEPLSVRAIRLASASPRPADTLLRLARGPSAPPARGPPATS